MGDKTRLKNGQAVLRLAHLAPALVKLSAQLNDLHDCPEETTYAEGVRIKKEYDETVNEVRDLSDWLFDSDNVLDPDDTTYKDLMEEVADQRIDEWKPPEAQETK